MYPFTVMHFGLKNDPLIFRRALDAIIASARWPFSMVFLDNTVFLSKLPVDQIGQLWRVLRVLYDSYVSLQEKHTGSLPRRLTNQTISFSPAFSILQTRQPTRWLRSGTSLHRRNSTPFWVCVMYLCGSYKILPISLPRFQNIESKQVENFWLSRSKERYRSFVIKKDS